MVYNCPKVLMKKILFILFISFSINCNSQEKNFPKNSDGDYEFSEVVESDYSKSTLYSNAISWAMKLYGNYKDVVQYESNEEGRLVIKGFGGHGCYKPKDKGKIERVNEEFSYTISIDCKDNKYRYVVNDIEINEVEFKSNGFYAGPWKKKVTHENHIEEINTLTMKIDSINSLIQNTKKASALRKMESEKMDAEGNIKFHNEMYEQEYLFFENLINNLKSKMAVNTNF